MFGEGFNWIKFLILFIPFLVLVMFAAPTFKWKIVFAVAGVIGIWLALNGKTMKGFTPMARGGW
jgi:hypothetical protein